MTNEARAHNQPSIAAVYIPNAPQYDTQRIDTFRPFLRNPFRQHNIRCRLSTYLWPYYCPVRLTAAKYVQLREYDRQANSDWCDVD
jgi:hypothetical protein